MELLDGLRSAVLQQREDEVTNFFSNVGDLREFISSSEPAAGVNVTIKMCCHASERLIADNGTRVTLVDSMAHGLFDEVQETLSELNNVNRKPFIAQVTVWDAKRKTGSPRVARVNFRVDAVYEFRQVHNIGYFSDIAKGSVQLEVPASDRIVEVHPPVLKCKSAPVQSGRSPKARALVQRDGDEEENRDGASGSVVEGRAVAAAAEAGSPAAGKVPRTRNAMATRG